MENTNKKQLGEAAEKLEAMGQENEHEGIKWTKYFMDAFNKKEWEEEQIKTAKLDHSRRYSKRGYYEMLAKMLDEECRDLDLTIRFTATGYPNKEGVVINMVDHKTGLQFKRGMKPSGIPKYDYYGITVLLMQAQNTAESIERGNDDLVTTKSGIILT